MKCDCNERCPDCTDAPEHRVGDHGRCERCLTDLKPLSTLLGELDALVKGWERRSRNAASAGEDRALKDCARELRTVTPALKEGIERLERRAELAEHIRETLGKDADAVLKLLTEGAAYTIENDRLRALVVQQRGVLQAIVADCAKNVGEIAWPPGVDLIAKARAVLATEGDDHA